MSKGNRTRHRGHGPPKGAKYKKTLDKEAAREYVRQRITAELEPLLDAQLKHAKGLNYLVARAKAGGKFERIEASRVPNLDPDSYMVEVWEKDPSVQAFTDLMNRAVDKPKEQIQDVNIQGHLELVGAALDRIKERNRGKSRPS